MNSIVKIALLLIMLSVSSFSAELGRDLMKPGSDIVLDITNEDIKFGPEAKIQLPKNIIEIESNIVNGQIVCDRGLGLFQTADKCYKYECPVGSVDTGGLCVSLNDTCSGQKNDCSRGIINKGTLFCEDEGACSIGYEEMNYGYCGKEMTKDTDKSADPSIQDTHRTVTTTTSKMCMGIVIGGECYSNATIAATEKTNLACVNKSVLCMPGASSCCHIDLTCSGDAATVKYYDCCSPAGSLKKSTTISDVSNFINGFKYQPNSASGKIICNSSGACSIYFQNYWCGGRGGLGEPFLANSFTLKQSTAYECNDAGYYIGSKIGADPLQCYTLTDLECPVGFMDNGGEGSSACTQYLYCDDQDNEHLTEVGGTWACAYYNKKPMGCESANATYDSRIKKCVEHSTTSCSN